MFLFARELLLIRISAIFDHIWESKAQNPPKKREYAESVYKTLYLCDRNLLRIKENLDLIWKIFYFGLGQIHWS